MNGALRNAIGARMELVFVVGCSRCSAEESFPVDDQERAAARAHEAGWGARKVRRADSYWSGLLVLCPQCADDLREAGQP